MCSGWKHLSAQKVSSAFNKFYVFGLCDNELEDIHNDECKGKASVMLDKPIGWICALLQDHCCLIITDKRGEMAAHFSHEAGGATMH